jgi:hypothetical protein
MSAEEHQHSADGLVFGVGSQAALPSVEQQTINYYDNHAEHWVVTRGGNEGLSYWH